MSVQKIGKKAKEYFIKQLENNEFNGELLNNLQDKKYSKSTLNVNFPILVKNVSDEIKKRYYSKPVNGYYITNDWYEKSSYKLDEFIQANSDGNTSKEDTVNQNDLQVIKMNEDSKTTISIPEIITEIKNVYSGHENLEEIVTDLEGGGYFDYWANKFSQPEFPANLKIAKSLYMQQLLTCENGRDLSELASSVAETNGLNEKEWAKEIFTKALSLENNTNDVLSIAGQVADQDGLSDKQWAITLYKKVEESLDELVTYNDLANGISKNLNDQVWASKVLDNATKALKAADDIFSFSGYPDELLKLGKSLADEDIGNDKEAAKEIFEMVLRYESVTDPLDAARAVQEIYDAEYASEFSIKALDRAIECVQEGYYCDIYYFIKDDIEDIDRANEYKDQYYDEMRDDYENYESCEEIFGDTENEEADFNEYEDQRCVVRVKSLFAFLNEDIFIETEEDAEELAEEKINEFISEFKDTVEGHMEEKIFIDIDSEKDVHSRYEETKIYFVLTKAIPKDILNSLFLDMDDYSFHSSFEDEDGQLITQGYDEGEYDTGYFDSDGMDNYINVYIDEFNAAKNKLLG